MKTRRKSENRFENDANRYAAYLETPEGRLREDLAFANVQDLLLTAPKITLMRALDLGCGTGSVAVRLAQIGIQVTALDCSLAMLDLVKRKVAEAGVRDKITLTHGDVARLADGFQKSSFDIIICHNLLEYVDEPSAVLGGAARLMRDSAMLSVVVRNQAGEVLKAALQAGDLAAAERSLTAEWGQESLYGGRVRLFTGEALEAMLKDASLEISARSGVRVVADYLPAQISRSAEYERIFALERKIGKRQEFFGVARYMQCLASRTIRQSEGDE
jgi:S-adenosylmethionine-dependent methyltransferase